MRRTHPSTRSRILAWSLLPLGCSPGAVNQDTNGSTTRSPPLASSTDSSDGSDDTGNAFVVRPDIGPTKDCNLYTQDCDGESKCAPYASDMGARPDGTRCIPLSDPARELGESCHVRESRTSGLDDCAAGLFCVVHDAKQRLGTCVALCADQGGEDLGCEDPNARCIGAPDVLPRLCSAGCDPLGDTCAEGLGCYRVGDNLVCLTDTSGPGGSYGEPCTFTNACDSGMLCADPPEFDGCSHAGCCTPMCDTRDPAASANCPGAPTHRCEPLFEPGQGPPLFSWVGACVVPTPDGP